ncbi:hypothetical protein CANMA_002859 [Candida margitis]|uniref:uncharacterized protein n=1 Tax=Candida margitis TaxID=1775924 RepID=UPI0022277350|nr:uncharacterized protein CANMA_002859 [Candida margitis]KAI5967679.1 hypothetical protein CANMA_002859 [Candida margitis]
MSSQRKLNGYLERKDSLIKQYRALKPDFSHHQQPLYYILIKLDELVYEYNVCKSYLETQQQTNKPPITDVTLSQTKLKFIHDKIRQIEDSIYYNELVAVAPRLAIIRKEITENAREAGKIILSYEVQNPKQQWRLLDERIYELRPTLLEDNDQGKSKKRGGRKQKINKARVGGD